MRRHDVDDGFTEPAGTKPGIILVRIAGLICLAFAVGSTAAAQIAQPHNPVLPGWYADPEAHVFDGKYWIFPTYSAPYDQQTLMDAFSSTDLVSWEKHPRVLDISNVTW